MCGICGYYDLKRANRVKDPRIIRSMAQKLLHRGPDGDNYYEDQNLSLGFTRLSIIDLEGGMQPIFNEDRSVVLICNGEIFNYIELKKDLVKRGHKFSTKTDVETILHLYEEKGLDFFLSLNGQFAIVLFDFKKQQLICARDHLGILPLYYTVKKGFFIFGSEIKSILEHPELKNERQVDLVALDQLITFPGILSPRTMFKDINSVQNGHYLLVDSASGIKQIEYWDLNYPAKDFDYGVKDEKYYTERLDELLSLSVQRRMRSDVPVGVYISGGLDSSIIASKYANFNHSNPNASFSIDFPDKTISENNYQNIVREHINSIHNSIMFSDCNISERLPEVIYSCECGIKETYNTASYALSENVNRNNLKVILSGEGADELFAGYVGYKFDQLRLMNPQLNQENDSVDEEALRIKLSGHSNFFYEKKYHEFSFAKKQLYSTEIANNYKQFDCFNYLNINQERMFDRDIVHIRSYLDYKLRLVDHLVSDHGDRMSMANSVEVRYPFLDIDLIEFAKTIPPGLLLKDFKEKYILKKMASSFLPKTIIDREKFSFVAPGSSYLLKSNYEFINDILSFDTIKRQGYFNPIEVEKLKKQYTADNFKLNLPFDNDMLIIVLTFGIFLNTFKI